MGALYHLKQKLVDFCNVIQENVSRTDTVPSSKVVYDLKADTDADIQELNDSLTPTSTTVSDSHFQNIIITKTGNVKTLAITTVGSNTGMDTSVSYVTYFTIPEEYRPRASYTNRFQSLGPNGICNWLIQIATSGVVSFVNYDGVAHPAFTNVFVYI